MVSNISWREYWTLLAVFTLAYYLLIYLIYFRKELSLRFASQKQMFHQNPSGKKQSQPTLFESGNSHSRQIARNGGEDIVYACMDELNAFFENQAKSKAVESEVVYALHGILQKYPSLNNSEYKDSITNVIATQCENICSIHLSVEELKGVWFG